MKNKYTLLLLLVVLLFYACRKNFTNKSENPVSRAGLTIQQAKDYLNGSVNTTSGTFKLQSLHPGKNANTTGYVYWKRARELNAGQFNVVEIPLIINNGSKVLYDFPRDGVSNKPDISVAQASFSRLIIYQNVNAKNIQKEIITYQPDKDYLARNHNDASKNWLDNIAADFSGYIEYKTWEGKPKFVLRLVNGKTTGRYNLTYLPNGAPKEQIQSLQTNDIICQYICNPVIGTNCWIKENGDEECIDVYEGYDDCFESCYDTGTPPSDPPPGGGGDGSGPTDPTSGGGTTATTNPANNSQFTQGINKKNIPPCFGNVFNALESQTSNCVASFISAFSGDTPGFNWVLDSGGANSTNNAVTSAKVNNGVYTTTTTFYEDNFQNGSDLAVAKTILHEGLHAYLTTYFVTNHAEAAATYSQMLDDYVTQKHPDMNAAEHNEFVRDFLGTLATQLQLYGQSQNYNLDYQYYQDLAWGGLTDTAAFKALPIADQNRIKDVITTEQGGQDRNGNPTTMKGKSPGC